MKIMVYGYSGSGKSTLSEYISSIYDTPILYADHTLYGDNWTHKTEEETKNEIQNFIKSNKNWIIDGNATRVLFNERAKLADKIIFLDFGRFECYKNAKNRFKQYKNKSRVSRPKNSEERFNFSFKMWILFGGRKRKRKELYNSLVVKYPEKIIVLKNEKDVQAFKENIDHLLLY